MSRIGQKAIEIPAGVTLLATDREVTVTGGRGTLRQVLHPDIEVLQIEGKIQVRPKITSRSVRALHGLFRQLVANMIQGVHQGYERRLEMKGTGYRAEVQGEEVVIHAGYSHPVRVAAPAGIEFRVEKNTSIIVSGIDRQLVGETAAKIRAVRKPEPYKGKGIRYSDEVLRLKPGKAAKAAAA